MAHPFTCPPSNPFDDQPVTAVLALADGAVFRGQGLGMIGEAVGEVCFNTAISGYQEILTDPSYAGQIITFTFPHIGNVGTNEDDIETANKAARSGVRGCLLRANATDPSNFRAAQDLNAWLKARGIIGLCGIDTRALTRYIREQGMPNGVIAHAPDGKFDEAALVAKAAAWPGLEGADLAIEVATTQRYSWNETGWQLGTGYGTKSAGAFHVVAIDYGVKGTILRLLVDAGCRLTVVPPTLSAQEILALKPDGIFLSNGPGDPAATGVYAVPIIRDLVASGLPVFGICLGHQLLALALGANTIKMHQGHHGANHPVLDHTTEKVEITSMNHGFAVDAASLPPGICETHISLFDRSNCGLQVTGKPIFSVQYHPEASPGPRDSHYLFTRFVNEMRRRAGQPILEERTKLGAA